MFTYFTDRDGRFQLSSLAESGFDPLARTCQFMLKEEAHHMFVGTSGIGRVVQRTCELMKEHDTEDLRDHGGIDLATLQRYLNFHYSVSLDLFGGETSTNVANYYTAGLKGRFQETSRDDDHRLESSNYPLHEVRDGKVVANETKTLLALNEVLRDDYVDDCAKGVARWNRTIREAGIDFELKLPHRGFHRQVGSFTGHYVTPDGQVVSHEDWNSQADRWLPTAADREYVNSLMVGVHERGKMANWIAPPGSGVAGKPVDFEYVRL
jgi:benzoyl-CoA 2,3-dioxygenase component B